MSQSRTLQIPFKWVNSIKERTHMFHLGFSLLTFSPFSPSGASAFNFSFRRATLQKREVPTGPHIYISYVPTCKAMNLNVLKTQCYICFPVFFLIQNTRDRVRKKCSFLIIEKGCFLFFIATLLHFYDYYFYLLHCSNNPVWVFLYANEKPK